MHPFGRVVFPVDIINITRLSTNVKTAGIGWNGGLRGCRRRWGWLFRVRVENVHVVAPPIHDVFGRVGKRRSVFVGESDVPA